MDGMPSTSVDEETENTPPGNTADVDEKTTAEHEAVEGGEEAERDSEVLWGAVRDSDVGPGIDEECFVASIEHASHPFALVKTSVVALSGLIVAATIRFLTGRGKDGSGKSDSRQRVEPAAEEDHEENLSSGPIISESENVAYGGMIRELGELKADNLILSAKCEDLEEELLEMTGVLDAANGEIQELKKQIMDLVEED